MAVLHALPFLVQKPHSHSQEDDFLLKQIIFQVRGSIYLPVPFTKEYEHIYSVFCHPYKGH